MSTAPSVTRGASRSASCKRLATSTRTCSGVCVRSPLRPSRLPGRTRLHRLTSMALSSRPRLSRSCAAGPSWPIRRRRRRRRRSSRSRQSPIPRSVSPHQTHRPIQLIVAFPPQEAVLPLPLHPELGGEEGHYQTVWRRSTAVNEFGMALFVPKPEPSSAHGGSGRHTIKIDHDPPSPVAVRFEPEK